MRLKKHIATHFAERLAFLAEIFNATNKTTDKNNITWVNIDGTGN